MQRKFLLILAFALGSTLGWSQEKKAAISFEQPSHDFGTIAEEGGPVSHEFVFTNTGEAPLVLSNVRPSCGCTTPTWSREPIAPGEQGTIVAQYNPRNRPGSFNKSISVTSNADQQRVVLYIRGVVQPKPRTPKDDYPTQVGALRVKYRSFNMGKVLTNEPAVKSFEVFNDSQQPVAFTGEPVAPAYINITFEPRELQPGQKGNIKVSYDAAARKSLGFASDRVRLFTNEEEDSIKEFTVMATIEEYFPPMTEEELAQAPRLTLSQSSYDFGTISEGELVKTDFTFTNTGKSPLNIRKTKANCGCTVSKPDKTTLAPGESSKITVTFNSQGRRGRQHKMVTIFSNDPKAPTQRISIKGRVNAGE
jgi:uncharacterized cupredoxin-like copper-binding protein